MKKEHIYFLAKHRVMYKNYLAAKVIAHLSNPDSEKFLEIAKHYDPKYNVNLWCGDCVVEMICFVYRSYDAEQQQEEVQETAPPQEVPPAAPKQPQAPKPPKPPKRVIIKPVETNKTK